MATTWSPGDAKLQTGDTILVTGRARVYVTGDFIMQGSSSIIIAPGASLQLYVGGANTTISTLNNAGNCATFTYFGLPANTSVTLSGNDVFLGTIYAPSADLTMSGGGNSTLDYQGACAVNTIGMNGHFNFHFDENLKRRGPFAVTRLPPGPKSKTMKTRLNTKHVLLVDDDPLVLRMYQEGLARQGVQVEAASSGSAAVEALRSRTPEVVVLDLMMPQFTGVDVLKFIRSDERLKALPVVVLSNSYTNGLAADVAALGVQKALLKVRCSAAILVQTINDLLAGRSSSDDTALLFAGPEQNSSVARPLTPPEPAKWSGARARAERGPGRHGRVVRQSEQRFPSGHARDMRLPARPLPGRRPCAELSRAHRAPAGLVWQGPFHRRRCRPRRMLSPGPDGQRVRGTAPRAH